MSDLGIKNNKNNGCKGQLFVAVVLFYYRVFRCTCG